jgi:NADH-quinone oxidoreductase subunit L
MMSADCMLTWVLLFPLLGFTVNGLIHLVKLRTNNHDHSAHSLVSGWIATVCMIASFLLSVVLLFQLKEMTPPNSLIEANLFHWIALPSGAVGTSGLILDFILRYDYLSSIFVLVITGVGSLIHLYSIGYMSHDATPSRYFSYLNLFCFMMLILVLGASLPMVFMGWEGVGLASYLLIGYWHQDFDKVKAGQKAFIMNRIGDLGFLLAMFVIFTAVGTLDMLQINSLVGSISPEIATAFGLLVFFACTGKSAQLPLFTWLPDAMAGPTPVSALIHAATMVTSGIYLLTRLSPVILASSTTLTVIAVIGGCTALITATMACAQSDIKKVLAYSTVSQLGLMFLACGVGAFDVAVFHVMTHAFFKALLFLAAGSVIHALNEEQNIFKMGGLRKKIPITFFTFLMGWAAILGLPPFSGFFSKDEILIQAFTSPNGSWALGLMGSATALLTAFYMTRLMILVFFGTKRLDSKTEKNIHESPLLMTIPLMVLSLLALIGGFWGSPIATDHSATRHDGSAVTIMIVSVVVAVLSAWIACKKYNGMKTEEQSSAFLSRAWHIDEAYQWFFGKGVNAVSKAAFQLIEQGLIQRTIRWTASCVDFSGSLLRSFQVGSMQVYLLITVVTVMALLFSVMNLSPNGGQS